MAIERYGTTSQQGDNIALVHTLYGQPAAQGQTNPNGATGGDIQPAGVFSTAPVRNPPTKRCAAKNGTCKGYRSKGSEYCAGHLRSFGIIKQKPKTVDEPG